MKLIQLILNVLIPILCAAPEDGDNEKVEIHYSLHSKTF